MSWVTLEGKRRRSMEGGERILRICKGFRVGKGGIMEEGKVV